MARPLRLEYPGALYHVTSRGDGREDVFLDDPDREAFLELLGEVCGRFAWTVYAYCLMTNHYHLLIETAEPTLSRGMRQVNGVYTQRFNRRHDRVGHVFQGRFKAILVQRDAYLLELCRYVVLNPLRAGMTGDPGQWPWTSYHATVGEVPAPAWLDADWVLGQFGQTRSRAQAAYRRFVGEGLGRPSPWSEVRHQIVLGDAAFAARFGGVEEKDALREVPKAQRQLVSASLAEIATNSPDRDQAMARAYRSGVYTMKAIAEHFGVHYITVSRAVRRVERLQAGSGGTGGVGM
jgi:REP element-mobilizing transposase RayT